MEFKIETHLHTSQASACASASGREQALYRKAEGYDAIIVTDHFYRGNCRVDRNLPWEEFIDEFCSGYEDAKRTGDEIGLKVFFGWEENFDGAEMLVYGLDKEWLKKHPEMTGWTPKIHYDKIHEAGGFVVQPHPFRERDYLEGIKLYPYYCDAAETVNMGNRPIENTRAKAYAKDFGLLETGGSDIHHKETKGGGMIFDHELNSVFDYIEAIKSKEGKIIHYDEF